MSVYEKDLADGGRALGFFNLGDKAADLHFNHFAQLHLAGRQQVRDLWRQKDVAVVDTAADTLPMTLPPHGVMLYKFTATK